jgi:DNA-binding MarR family transcriptional regulator
VACGSACVAGDSRVSRWSVEFCHAHRVHNEVPGHSAEHGLGPLMVASRVVIATAVRAVASVRRDLTLSQLRVLVVLDERGPTHLSDVADTLGVNPSTASRACDRLVGAGLVTRRSDPEDGRRIALSLSTTGRRLVRRILAARERLLADIVARMDTADRERLMAALRSFNEAAHEDDGVSPTAGRAWLA